MIGSARGSALLFKRANKGSNSRPSGDLFNTISYLSNYILLSNSFSNANIPRLTLSRDSILGLFYSYTP